MGVICVRYEILMIVVNSSYHIYCKEIIIMFKKEIIIMFKKEITIMFKKEITIMFKKGIIVTVIIVNCDDITTNSNDTQRHNYIRDITLEI
jgi:hypothetical protein